MFNPRNVESPSWYVCFLNKRYIRAIWCRCYGPFPSQIHHAVYGLESYIYVVVVPRYSFYEIHIEFLKCEFLLKRTLNEVVICMKFRVINPQHLSVTSLRVAINDSI